MGRVERVAERGVKGRGLALPPLRILTYSGREVGEIGKKMVTSLAELYKAIFEAPPWNEEWPIEKARETVEDYRVYIQTNGGLFQVLFVGKQGNWMPVGLSVVLFNYKLPRLVREDTLIVVGKAVTYGAEFGILPEYQGRGYGTLLMQARKMALLELVRDGKLEPYYYFRTINERMVGLTEKVMAGVRPVGRMPEDVYENRIYYKVFIGKS